MQTKLKKPSNRIWAVKKTLNEPYSNDVLQASKESGLSIVATQLLSIRGYKNANQISDYINLKTERLYNPEMMIGMDKATQRIKEAIEKKEHITIYGDYDVDGVTSVCTILLYLRSCGAHVDYYIPDRIADGYGVSVNVIQKLKEQGTELIVTVDNGITANNEVDFANSLGIDVVVTDHHTCVEELPHAVAVVNPHQPNDPYPFKELAGVGVVFKLITSLEMLLHNCSIGQAVSSLIREYGDLVAIGTIADVMPVKDENRIIIKYGLASLERQPRFGLKALIDCFSAPTQENPKAKTVGKITTSFIGYNIAPRLNAAGRILTASVAVELLLSNDYESAMTYAQQLCEANKKRQTLENEILEDAMKMVQETFDFEHDKVIVLASDKWPQGVIGVVSSRITDYFGYPSILISFDGTNLIDGEVVGKGSGRSIKGMNLVEALIACKDILPKCGGHELAAGLSVKRERLEEFKKAINDYAREVFQEQQLVQTIDVDMEINAEDITLDLAEQVMKFEPYGVENQMPVFVVRDISVNEVTGVSNNKHTKFSLVKNGKYITAMYFGQSPQMTDIFNGDLVDVAFNIDINEYNGRRTAQINVKDIRLAQSVVEKENKEKEVYNAICNGETFTDKSYLPERPDFVILFEKIKKWCRFEQNEQTMRSMLSAYMPYEKMNYVKLKFMLKVFHELNIVTIEMDENDGYTFHLRSFDSKKELEKSYQLKKLRNQYREV